MSILNFVKNNFKFIGLNICVVSGGAYMINTIVNCYAIQKQFNNYNYSDEYSDGNIALLNSITNNKKNEFNKIMENIKYYDRKKKYIPFLSNSIYVNYSALILESALLCNFCMLDEILEKSKCATRPVFVKGMISKIKNSKLDKKNKTKIFEYLIDKNVLNANNI